MCNPMYFMNGIPMIASIQHRIRVNNIPTASNFWGDANEAKRKIIAASRVPAPPKVIGICPIKIAMGKFAIISTRGMDNPTASQSIIV